MLAYFTHAFFSLRVENVLKLCLVLKYIGPVVMELHGPTDRLDRDGRKYSGTFWIHLSIKMRVSSKELMKESIVSKYQHLWRFIKIRLHMSLEKKPLPLIDWIVSLVWSWTHEMQPLFKLYTLFNFSAAVKLYRTVSQQESSAWNSKTWSTLPR